MPCAKILKASVTWSLWQRAQDSLDLLISLEMSVGSVIFEAQAWYTAGVEYHVVGETVGAGWGGWDPWAESPRWSKLNRHSSLIYCWGLLPDLGCTSLSHDLSLFGSERKPSLSSWEKILTKMQETRTRGKTFTFSSATSQYKRLMPCYICTECLFFCYQSWSRNIYLHYMCVYIYIYTIYVYINTHTSF